LEKKYKFPIYILSIIVFSKLFFYPLNIETRFSVGIIVLHFILLVETGNLYKKLVGYSAAFIFLERLLFFTLFEGLSIGAGFIKTYPIIFYYITYIAILIGFKFEKKKTFYRYGIIFLADAFSNIVELILRGELSILSTEYILLVSFIRVSGAFLIYLIYKYRVMIITDEIHQEKYLSLNLMVSSLEAELFYLKKSTGDIEEVMRKAHNLYQNENSDPDVREKCLDIAREVHEIKKDYLRITRGMELDLSSFKKNNSLSLSKLREIIFENTKKYIQVSEKDIDFTVSSVPIMPLNDYHKVFILINNLITNSIDAIEKSGAIKLSFLKTEEDLIIKVSDTGKGIPEKNVKLLFNAGFTTKYNMETGEMNTGLGLSHVKNIVESLKGSISVESNGDSGTLFTAKIPLEML